MNEIQTTAGTAPSLAFAGNVESNRAMALVQAQTIMAKQFPRNQIQARNDIIEACKRRRLAEAAIYSYPRGGTKVEGPSIRLAESIAQNWGNIDFGVTELERKPERNGKPGESLVMAFCIDFQTNTRRQTTFSVPHIRYSRAKGNTKLTDPRDIDEMILNKAARRLRACILAIIPGDVIEEAVEQCNKTLAGRSDKPLIDRVKDMVKLFGEVGVSQEKLEKRLGHKVDACLEIDIVNLGKIYKSLKDEMSKPEDWFDDASKAPPRRQEGEPKKEDVKLHPDVIRLKELTEDRSKQQYIDALIKTGEFDGHEINSAIQHNSAENAKQIADQIEAAIHPELVESIEELKEIYESEEWARIYGPLAAAGTLTDKMVKDALKDDSGEKARIILDLFRR